MSNSSISIWLRLYGCSFQRPGVIGCFDDIFHRSWFFSRFFAQHHLHKRRPPPSLLQMCGSTGKMLKIAKVDVFPQLSNSSSSPLNLLDLNGLSCPMWAVFLLITSPSNFSQLSFLDTLKSEYGSTTIQFHISEKAFAVIFLPSQFSNLFSQTENCFRSSRIFLPGLRKRKQGPGGCKSCARGDN